MGDIEATFRDLNRLLRKASIAEIGGFRPPANLITSWFGGKGIGLPGEQLPDYEGKELFPLLQVVTSELPFRPPQLDGITALVVFIDRVDIPLMTPHGEGWLIREYTGLDHLVPLPPSSLPPVVRSFPIRWRLVTDDAPGWEAAASLIDINPIADSDDATRRFWDDYHRHQGTKLGGWPEEIQQGLIGVENFVFQIDSNSDAGWQWGDAGIGYFMKDPDGTWHFSWDCC